MISNLEKARSLNRLFYNTARCLVIAAAIMLPFSSRWANTFMIASIAGIIITPSWGDKARLVWKSRATMVAILLVALFAIGLLYSYVDVKTALSEGFFKYTKLLYIISPLILFRHEKWRKSLLIAFVVSVFINVLLISLNEVGPLWLRSGPHQIGLSNLPLINPIYVSVQAAFMIFILLQWVTFKHNFRVIVVLLLLFSLYFMFFINVERTGYLITLILLFVFVIQHWKIKGFWISVIAIPIVIIGLFSFSNAFRQRIEAIGNNIVLFKARNVHTSIGYRLAFAIDSFQVIKRHPIIGTGTGSFSEVYHHSGGQNLKPNRSLGHPHNEYIMITFQLGVIGLLAFLYWLYTLWAESRALEKESSHLLKGLVVTLVINSFTNVSIYVGGTGIFYAIFIGALLAARNVYMSPKKVEASC